MIGCVGLALIVILACVVVVALDAFRILPDFFYEPIRWLGLESPYDFASVEVSHDGINWMDLWVPGLAHVSDGDWQYVEYAVPGEIGDNQPALYFRWGLGPTDASVSYPGWNIDDVQVMGEPI